MITSANGHLVAERLHRWRLHLEPLTKTVTGVVNGEFFSYAPIDDIVKHVSKPLAKFGLYVVQTVTGDCGVTTRIFHKEGEWIEDTATVSAKTLDDKGAAITRLRRYALITMLGLPTVDAPKEESEVEKLLAPFSEAQRVVVVKRGISWTEADEELTKKLAKKAKADQDAYSQRLTRASDAPIDIQQGEPPCL